MVIMCVSQGLDASMHGEHAYDEDAIKRLQKVRPGGRRGGRERER